MSNSTNLVILSVQDMVMSCSPCNTLSQVWTGPRHRTGTVPSPDSILVRRWLRCFLVRCLLLCTENNNTMTCHVSGFPLEHSFSSSLIQPAVSKHYKSVGLTVFTCTAGNVVEWVISLRALKKPGFHKSAHTSSRLIIWFLIYILLILKAEFKDLVQKKKLFSLICLRHTDIVELKTSFIIN